MSIVSGSKAWQYFLERKIQRKVECKNNVQRISTSGLLRHLKNAHKELDLNMKCPHEDTGSETENV